MIGNLPDAAISGTVMLPIWSGIGQGTCWLGVDMVGRPARTGRVRRAGGVHVAANYHRSLRRGPGAGGAAGGRGAPVCPQPPPEAAGAAGAGGGVLLPRSGA